MLGQGIVRVLPWATAAAILSTAGVANASGFASARFGGERGNPTEDNPSTLYYNPAGMGFSTGTNILIDLNTAFRTSTIDRPTSVIDIQNPFPDDAARNAAALDANSGKGTLSNTILAPMVGVTTDFGLDMPLKVGAAFYAPFGGQAVWDKNDAADPSFPGAIDGSQRWYSIDGTIRTLAITAGAAYYIEPARLSIGLTGNVYLNTIETLRARNSDGTDDLEVAGTLKEGRSLVSVTSTDYGMGAGVLWEAWRRKAWIGLSYQTRPNFDGKMELDGTLQNYLGAAQGNKSDVILTSSLPDILRFGIRVRPKFRYEIRLFGDFTRWSAMENQCLVDKNVEDIDSACAVNADGSFANPDADTGRVIQNLARNWNDAFGIRLGASYWFDKDLELQLGGGYDSNAIPDEAIDAALMDMDKFSASLGVDYKFTDWIGLGVSATNIFYLERDTSDSKGNNDLVLPSKQPGNQGVYSQNIFVLNTNVRLTF
ncbi:MAG: outer membrane protein transport protein [bacterium]